MQVIHHQMAVTQAAPGLSIGRIQLEDILQVLDRFGELLLGAKNARDGVHSGDRPLVVTQGLFVRSHGAIKISHQFSQAPFKPNG